MLECIGQTILEGVLVGGTLCCKKPVGMADTGLTVVKRAVAVDHSTFSETGSWSNCV